MQIQIFNNMHLSSIYALLIYCVQVSPTRIPMEFVNDHHSRGSFSTSSASSSTVDQDNKIIAKQTNLNADLIEQQKGKYREEIQTTRVLYQVGDSEEELPICAPNAVCSKIHLYETPWIERQCRCPKIPHTHIHMPYHVTDSNRLHDRHHYNQYIDEAKIKLTDNDDTQIDFENLDHELRTVLRNVDVLMDDLILSRNSNYNDYEIVDQTNTKNDDHHQQQQQNVYTDLEFYDARKLRHTSRRMDVHQAEVCPNSVGVDDGHTISDKTRRYKLCEPIYKLPQCRYFKDYTWTLKSSPELNFTEQIVHCRCPKNSVTYLIKREPFKTGTKGYTYLFACSPQSRLRCQRKEPCKLFTVRKRQEFLDEVNTNPLCQCPKNHRCPRHHTDTGVILGKRYIEDNIRTYSGYCMPEN